MTQDTEFTVVIPLYNKARHVARAVESVLQQTAADLWCVVVDDASVDHGPAIVSAIKDPRIRLLARDKPGPGGYAARNAGVAAADTSWVAFLDADDHWLPNHIQVLQQLQVQFPAADILSCGWEDHRRSGEVRRCAYHRCYADAGTHTVNLLQYLQRAADGCAPIWTSVAAVRRDLLLSVGGFPEGRCSRGGDRDTWLRLMLSGAVLAWSPHIGACYHRDSDNMVTNTIPAAPDHCIRATVRGYLKQRPPKRVGSALKRLQNAYVMDAVSQRIRHDRLRVCDCLNLYPLVAPLRFARVLAIALIPNAALRLARRLGRRLKRFALQRGLS